MLLPIHSRKTGMPCFTFILSYLGAFLIGAIARSYLVLQPAIPTMDFQEQQTNKERTPPVGVVQEEAAVSFNANDFIWSGEGTFFKVAKSLKPTTDKVTTHTYQIMYGMFLLPYYHRVQNMKYLEIGLGCDMHYGPGASVALSKALFPKAELWMAEYSGACVTKSKKRGLLDGINTLVGDQGNTETLDEWIEQSGGNFDVIVDDGGHKNCQIWTSFLKLWPTVKSGGLYFIEDMQVAKTAPYMNSDSPLCTKDTIVPNKLKEKIDELIYDTKRGGDIKFIFCQSEACVLGKK